MIALVPVSVSYGDDPVAGLRRFDPQLAAPEARATCGSPLGNLSVSAKDTSFLEVARARACERAAGRRVAVAVATGAIVVVLGLLGAARTPPTPRAPRTPRRRRPAREPGSPGSPGLPGQ